MLIYQSSSPKTLFEAILFWTELLRVNFFFHIILWQVLYQSSNLLQMLLKALHCTLLKVQNYTAL